MSTLRLEMRRDANISLRDVPVAVEIIGSTISTVRHVPLHEKANVDVEPGTYVIRARLPSGETIVTREVLRPRESKVVQLAHSKSPHEWLAWQQFLGEVPRRGSAVHLSAFPSTWLRLWTFSDGEWLPQRIPPAKRARTWEHDDHMAVRSLNPEKPVGLRFLQIGGAKIPWRLIALPPTPAEIQVLVRPSRIPTVQNGGLAVKVASMDHRAEALSHYLRSGSADAAAMIAGDVVLRTAVLLEALPPHDDRHAAEAEELLEKKLFSPFGASVGGYYLLRAGAFERMHTWPNNFANWVRWLPDAPLIHAWQLLRQNRIRGRPQARRRLREATERGLPVLTEGVRLLIDGLELFADQERQRGQRADPVEASLKRVRRYAAAMDWNERVTTFLAADPNTPDLQLVTGIPEDDETIEYLPGTQRRIAQRSVPQTLTYRFVVEPVGGKMTPTGLQTVMRTAVRGALKDIPRAGKFADFDAKAHVEAAFAGVGETAVALVINWGPGAADVASSAGTAMLPGTATAAAERFFNEYLAPRLRRANLLPSPARLVVTSADAAEGRRGAKPPKLRRKKR